MKINKERFLQNWHTEFGNGSEQELTEALKSITLYYCLECEE